MDADPAMPEFAERLPRPQFPLSTAHDGFLQPIGLEAFHGTMGPQANRHAAARSVVASDRDTVTRRPKVRSCAFPGQSLSIGAGRE